MRPAGDCLMPSLEITTKQGRKRLELWDKPVSIGRSPDNGMVLPDSRASRNHCVVECIDGRWCLRDLESRNGTQLNGELVTGVERLINGDVIKIGRAEVSFIDPEAAHKGELPEQGIADPDDLDDFLNVDVGTIDVDLNDLVDAADAKARWERKLQDMIENGVDRGYVEQDIDVLDARGIVVHEAHDGDDDDAAEGTRLFRRLLHAALRARATDIHVEPRVDDACIRLRVDGTMVTASHIPTRLLHRLLGIVKVLCELENSQRNQVQDGHFALTAKGHRVDFRVSLTPSVHGQKLVVRILDASNSPSRLHDLGLVPWMYEKIRTIATRDAGLLLACGPTGSGKTTTLYSCLREIDVEQRNAVTIEDPVEYYLEGATQIPVDAQQGNSFHTILRSVLRQDPDVIFVGEIRDTETATVAMQASMTGHLVYSTVHAKDSIGAVFRLLDLGIEPPLVANALNLVVAQRLVRLLCPRCRKGVDASPTQAMRMGEHVRGVTRVHVAVGCANCLKTGFRGRRGLYELLEVTDPIRDVIMKGPTIGAIRDLAKQGLFTTLESFGFDLVASGETTFEEVDRVAGSE